MRVYILVCNSGYIEMERSPKMRFDKNTVMRCKPVLLCR